MHATDPINRLMTQPVVTVPVNASIPEMMETFVANHFHHLPVVKQRFVVGMLSTADLMKLEYFLPPPGPARERLLQQRFRVDQLMRAPVVTISEHESVQTAAERMAQNGIHALPVINHKNHLIGIVTTTDLMHACLVKSAYAREADGHTAMVDGRLAEVLVSARDALSRGDDDEGIAGALLFLQQRVGVLEKVRHEAIRYLNAGQDSQLHAALTRALAQADRFEQQFGKAMLLDAETQ